MSRYSSAHEHASGTVGAPKENMKTVVEIQGAEFERGLAAIAVPVLVHFYTSWCAQCQILSPSLEALAGELANTIQIARVNLDHCPELAKRYGIAEVPALILFDDRATIVRLDAWMPPRQMKAQLQGVLADYSSHPRIAIAG